jgi:predicted kinase
MPILKLKGLFFINGLIRKKRKIMKVYILRGVSGSGKSTFASRLSKNKIVHSTDDYFYKNGKYRFDISKLEYFHKKNFEEFVKSLKKRKRNVVVDNTNLLCSFANPYIQKAKEHGYRVILVEFQPKGREFHYKRNVHRVPKSVISYQIKMFKKFRGKIKTDKKVRIFV